ncbi:hypothetical protein DSM112329_05271 [Paraconexibacter sp. AEG42_29]|uniref:Uncharacterized protein n=1 Tax=Paraconexibacter sp. AEG42_29 TaxID=2997339 RepID=A0AAU7B3C6_9ACTN
MSQPVAVPVGPAAKPASDGPGAGYWLLGSAAFGLAHLAAAAWALSAIGAGGLIGAALADAVWIGLLAAQVAVLGRGAGLQRMAAARRRTWLAISVPLAAFGAAVWVMVGYLALGLVLVVACAGVEKCLS